MEEKRIEAKSMDKVAMCYGCRKEFLKEKMRRCKGCDAAQYCSNECYKKDTCDNKYGTSSAPTPAAVPSSVEEQSNVDAEEE